MIWLPETFRKERSLAWRLAMQRARAHAKAELLKARGDLPTETKANDRPARTTTFLAPSPSQFERNDAPPQPAFSTLNRVKSALSLRSGEDNVKIHLRDVNVSTWFARRCLALAADRLSHSPLLQLAKYFGGRRTSSPLPSVVSSSLHSIASPSRHQGRSPPRLTTTMRFGSDSCCFALVQETLCISLVFLSSRYRL